MKDTVDRRIGKRGIAYEGEFYTFEEYEDQIGVVVTFFVQEDYLVVALGDEVFHAQRQDTNISAREKSMKLMKQMDDIVGSM